MGRVFAYGIDAMDSVLLDRFESSLPNLRRLRQSFPRVNMQSIFPPDTPSAWATIYTGLNPARHGIILFVDPLDRVSTTAFQDVDNLPVKGRTFWDVAGRQGKKVCVLFPELGHPIWEVNGVMAGRTSHMFDSANSVQISPSSLMSPDLQRLARVKAMPQVKLYPEYIRAHKKLALAEAEFALKMWRKEKWDLMFLYSTALDWIGHNLWSFFDKDDPMYTPGTRFESEFLEFYRLYDRIVGEFMSSAGPDTTFIVFSDHGQGLRPVKIANVNRLLRDSGLLVSRIKRPSPASPYYLLEESKKLAARVISKRGSGKLLTRFIHAFPAVKRVYTSPLSIDWKRTAAYVTDLSGIKSYAYGGVKVNKNALADRDYEETRTSLIREIGAIKDGEQPLVKWVRRREELYQGQYIEKYPDVVFLLRNDYGVGWDPNGPLISMSATHSIQPGSHRIDTPVFLAWNAGNRTVNRQEATLMDIAPTILQLLGAVPETTMDGISLLGPESSAKRD